MSVSKKIKYENNYNIKLKKKLPNTVENNKKLELSKEKLYQIFFLVLVGIFKNIVQT